MEVQATKKKMMADLPSPPHEQQEQEQEQEQQLQELEQEQQSSNPNLVLWLPFSCMKSESQPTALAF